MRIECEAVELPDYPKHSNRLPFLGVLWFVDTPSDEAPSGARGNRIILTREAAVKALGSIVGMGLCRRSDNSGHNVERKMGVITKAYLLGNRIIVKGIVYAKDCPNDVYQLRNGKFGMIYEIDEARVSDMRKEVWELSRITFTGAAVLLREKTAYKGTRFWLSADKAQNPLDKNCAL